MRGIYGQSIPADTPSVEQLEVLLAGYRVTVVLWVVLCLQREFIRYSAPKCNIIGSESLERVGHERHTIGLQLRRATLGSFAVNLSLLNLTR